MLEESARCLKKEDTLQLHQHIWKYLRQIRPGSLVGKFSISAVLGLLFLGATLGMNVSGAHAASVPSTACSAKDRAYLVVSGDTLSKIAYRYHTNWPLLATYNHIPNANLIYVDQTICIPAPGTVHNATPQVQPQIQYSAPVTHSAPAPVATPAPAVTPAPTQSSAITTYSAPVQTQYSGSVISMIDQVFGANAPAAIAVATCESSLNPSAYNASSSASGVFQILPSTWAGTSQAGGSVFNAAANIAAAHEIFVRDGYSWREWSCQP